MNVLITGKIHQAGINRLEQHYNIQQRRTETEQKLIQALQDKHAIVNLAHTEITKKVIEQTNLKAISNHSVGYDNVDIETATKHNIPVTNTPVSHETVADHAFALLLSTAKRVVDGNDYIRNGNYTKNEVMQLPGTDVHGKTLGIIGLGRIGKAIAQRAQGFNMNIQYHDIQRYHDFEDEHEIRYEEFKPLLQQADYITCTVPLTEATHHLISTDAFNHMQSSCIFINIGRGPVVDEQALITALKNDEIKAAALDVFEHEPHIPQELLNQECVVTPHIASDTHDNRKRMAITAANNLITMLKGETPEYLVNDVTI